MSTSLARAAPVRWRAAIAGTRALAEPLGERPVRLLWTSQLVSELGDWAARIAVTALVYDRTDSPALAGGAFVAGLLPWLGPGQVLAALADRYGRRGLMIASDVVRAVIFLLVALVAMPAWAVLGLVAAAGLATAPFEAARSAGLVEFTSAERVPGAIRLSAATYDAGTLLGYAAGGLLLAVATPAWACGLNAASFAVSALLVAGLPRPTAAGAGQGEDAAAVPARNPASAVLVAARALWTDAVVRAAALLGTVPVAAGTALEGQAVTWGAAAFPGARWVPGAVLAASTGVCLLLTLLVGPREAPWPTLRLAGLLAAGPAAAGAVAFAAGGPAAVAAGLVVIGALFVPIVLAQTVIAPRLDPARRATSFGLLMGLLTIAQAAVSPLVGVAVSGLGAPRAFALTSLTTGLLVLAVSAPAWRRETA